MKKMLRLGCLLGLLSFLEACDDPSYIGPIECSHDHLAECMITFSATPDPYPVSRTGSAVTIQTGRYIGDDEKVEVTLAQGQGPVPAKMLSGFRVERLSASIDVILFQKDLIDFQENSANPALNPATLTVSVTPFEGAEPQRFTVKLKISNM